MQRVVTGAGACGAPVCACCMKEWRGLLKGSGGLVPDHRMTLFWVGLRFWRSLGGISLAQPPPPPNPQLKSPRAEESFSSGCDGVVEHWWRGAALPVEGLRAFAPILRWFPLVGSMTHEAAGGAEKWMAPPPVDERRRPFPP